LRLPSWKVLKIIINRTLRAAGHRLHGIGRHEVLVLGDSHAEIFESPAIRSVFPHHHFNVVSVGGATISGLKNPNSVTQAMPVFERALGRSGSSICIVLLGEVDTGFVIWYRAKKDNIPVKEALGRALENYQDFLSKIALKRKVVCISAPLPTIVDGQDWGDVANQRKEIEASQLERTRLTVQFNEAMQSYCARSNIPYLNLDPESIGSDGVVKKSLRNRDSSNHHYEPREYLKLLLPRLTREVE